MSAHNMAASNGKYRSLVHVAPSQNSTKSLSSDTKDLQEPQDLFVGRSSAFSATKSGVYMCCQEHLDTPLQ